MKIRVEIELRSVGTTSVIHSADFDTDLEKDGLAFLDFADKAVLSGEDFISFLVRRLDNEGTGETGVPRTSVV